MDNFVYNSLTKYFHALSQLGYMSDKKQHSLLILLFYYHLIYHDYRGYISKDDYHLIGQALNCLYGTNCLIPYPDYLKMGKLKLGEMTEVLDRLKSQEDYSGQLSQRVYDNDVLIEDNIRRIDESYSRITALENTKVVKGKNHIQNIPDIDLSSYDVIDDGDSPTPTPTEQVVKTLRWTRVTSDNAGIGDEYTFYIDVDDIINTYNTHGNCILRAGNNAAARLWCCYYQSYDPNDGDTENIEKIEDDTAMSGMEEMNDCLYITLPYSLNAYSISYLERLKAASSENLGTLLILVDDGLEGPITNGELKIVYTE